MQIRPMQREDVEAVTELRLALLTELRELPPEEIEPLRRATRHFLQRQPETGRHFTSVAEEAGRLAGIASLEVFERRWARIVSPGPPGSPLGAREERDREMERRRRRW